MRSPGWLLTLALAFASALAFAQTSPTPTPLPPPGNDAEGGDSDPTRPVVWSLREEFYGSGDSWNNVLIFRSDRAFLADRSRLAGKRGILTRFDLPLAVAHQGALTKAGLGDLYAQVFLVPYLTQQRAFVVGSGFTLPTATDRLLGAGKFQVAPALAPVWFFPQRGFFFLKLQDYISVAGDDARRDVHYLSATPLFVWRLKNRPYWVQLDGESKTDFQNHSRTAFKAGFLFGRMVKRRGVWIKPEVYWGPTRDADFAIKLGFFSVR